MDPGRDVAVESHVADQAAFISNLKKSLEAPEEEAHSTSTASQPAQAPVVATAGVPADTPSWEPQERAAALENASRQSVHVRCDFTTYTSNQLHRPQQIVVSSIHGQELHTRSHVEHPRCS